MLELLSFVNYESIYIKIVTVVSAVAAILGYIFLRKVLKLPQTDFTKHTKQWCLEGVAMERITLLILLKDVLSCILGVLYLFFTIFTVLASFEVFRAGGVNEYTIPVWAAIFFVMPILIRIVFELVRIFIYKCLKYVIKFVIMVIVFVAKLIWRIVCCVARFVWDFAAAGSHIVVDLLRWIDAILKNHIEKNNKQREEIKKGNGIFYNPKFYTKEQIKK